VYDQPSFLKDIPYLQYRESHLIEPWFQSIRFEPHRTKGKMMMQDWRTLLHFVELGRGYSIMPSHLRFDEERVSYVDIPAKLLPGLRYSILFRKSLLAIQPIAHFLRTLRNNK
jgi:DNA-binding transcriptional LysR family regulator